MARAAGQDRSNWQTIGPWNIQGCTWGITKATEGLDFQDPTFPTNWANMATEMQDEANPLRHRGAYHFFHPQKDPELQADFFVSYVIAHGLGEQAILVIDDELSLATGVVAAAVPNSVNRRSHLLTADSTGLVNVRENQPASLLDVAHALTVGQATYKFLARVHEHRPHNPLWVYTNHSVGANLDEADIFPVWMAWPNLNPPDMAGMPWNDWIAWQWAWTGGWDNCDQDVYNGTAKQMDAWVSSFKAVQTDDYKTWSVIVPWSLAHEASVHRTTPEEMLETARRAGHLYGPAMAAYIEAGNWNARLPRHTELFTLVAC